MCKRQNLVDIFCLLSTVSFGLVVNKLQTVVKSEENIWSFSEANSEL